jgi:ParB/RepB/Spo0J family partition protein
MTYQDQKIAYVFPEQIEIVEGFNIRFELNELESLADSIKESGVKIPLLVKPTGEKTAGGAEKFHLVDGHRRLAAAIRVSAKKTDLQIPVMIKEVTQEEAIIFMIATGENQQKLSYLECAEGIRRLKDMGLKNSVIARKIGKSPTLVDDSLFLLENADVNHIDQIRHGRLSASAVIEILRVHEKELATEAIQTALDKTEDGKKVTAKSIEAEITTKTNGHYEMDEDDTDDLGESRMFVEGGNKPTSKDVADTFATDGTEETVTPKISPSVTHALALKAIRNLYIKLDKGNKRLKDAHSFQVLSNIISFLEGNKTTEDLKPLFFYTEEEMAEREREEKAAKKLKKEAEKADKKAAAKTEPEEEEEGSLEDDLDEEKEPEPTKIVAKKAVAKKDVANKPSLNINKTKAAAKKVEAEELLDEDFDNEDDLEETKPLSLKEKLAALKDEDFED